MRNSMFPLILASGSSSRYDLLKQLGMLPDQVIISDIDETHLPKELPKDLALRLSLAKANKVAEQIESGFILAADTVSSVGRRILPKAITAEDVRKCLKLYSGRWHQVQTGICVLAKKEGKLLGKSQKFVVSRVKFKHLTDTEIDEYVQSGEGEGKSGGCTIEGRLEKLIPKISGSYSNIRGLPLYETVNALEGLGYRK